MKHVSFVTAMSIFTLLCATVGCSKESAAAGRSETRFALSKPADQKISQGESQAVAIGIERTGFAEPVQITFSNLPAGVQVVDDVIPGNDSKREFVLVAAPTATVVEKHLVTVRAKGSSVTTSQTFALSVKAKS